MRFWKRREQPSAPEECEWLKKPREDFPLGLIRVDDPTIAVRIAADRLRDWGYLNADAYAAALDPKGHGVDDVLDMLTEHCPPYVRFGGQMEDEDALGFWVLWRSFDADREAERIPTYVNKFPMENLNGLAAWIGPIGDLKLYEGRPKHPTPFVVWQVI